jgi:hypothetical protein
MGIEDISNRLSNDDCVPIKKTFYVTKDLIREDINGGYCSDESICFYIGDVIGDYIQIDSDVIDTKHQFYFSKDIKLEQKMFVADRNISILKKIDRIIDNDFYVGGNLKADYAISKEAYLKLIKNFPKSAELDKYANSRISNILKEYFPECDKYEKIYEEFIEKKNNNILEIKESKYTPNSNLAIELAQFSTALTQLEEMLYNSEGIPEMVWQEKIQNILQLLYPKYIFCTREIQFKGVDGYEKRPDFILVDANGFVDILEIKKPDVQILTKQASYRNNYVPVREFAGAIQQIEKYIFCLTSVDKSKKDVLDKLGKLLSKDITPDIVNPQGILLLGRSNDFNVQQKRDFELIKRQYKNIADIMTYDDLIQRFKNITHSLKQKTGEKALK